MKEAHNTSSEQRILSCSRNAKWTSAQPWSPPAVGCRTVARQSTAPPRLTFRRPHLHLRHDVIPTEAALRPTRDLRFPVRKDPHVNLAALGLVRRARPQNTDSPLDSSPIRYFLIETAQRLELSATHTKYNAN